MARPRRVTDDDVLQATIDVLAGRGAGQTRLTDVAAVTGLAAPTLLQRFGSREALLDAAAGLLPGRVAAAFAVDGSPLGRLRAGLLAVAASGHLPVLVGRPADAASYSLELRKQIGYCLSQAVEAGELAFVPIGELAEQLQQTFFGLAVVLLFEGRTADAGDVERLLERVLGDRM